MVCFLQLFDLSAYSFRKSHPRPDPGRWNVITDCAPNSKFYNEKYQKMCLCAPQGNQADCSSNDYWAGKGYNRNAGERLFCSKSFTDAIIIYSFVKSNFKDGLYSSTFWFERIFISKIALVVLCPFSRKNGKKTTQNEQNFKIGLKHTRKS